MTSTLTETHVDGVIPAPRTRGVPGYDPETAVAELHASGLNFDDPLGGYSSDEMRAAFTAGYAAGLERASSAG